MFFYGFRATLICMKIPLVRFEEKFNLTFTKNPLVFRKSAIGDATGYDVIG